MSSCLCDYVIHVCLISMKTRIMCALGSICILCAEQSVLTWLSFNKCCCCCSVAESCPPLCDPMNCSTPGSLSSTIFWSLLKFMSIESVMLSNHFILYLPLLLLSSVFPSFRVFSNESALRIRGPKYLNFSFSISPSNEYSGLISFRID